MAKFLLFTLLFCINLFVLTPASATNHRDISENSSQPVVVCDAPAPDSLRVTSKGGSFISLAWKPAWEGANHVVYVSEKNDLGGWTALKTFPNVPGNSLTVDNLEGGKQYRFRIATKCPSGEPSELTAFVDDQTTIVELTLIGRNPKDPEDVDCMGILYQSFEWVGFKVIGEGESNIFEVQVNENSSSPAAYIRRVITANPIVAADQSGTFPSNFQQIIPNVIAPFRMVRLFTNNNPQKEVIGEINISLHKDPPKLDICVDASQFPWKNNYQFKTLTANETIFIPTGGGVKIQGFAKEPTVHRVQAQNPFNDRLSLFFPPDFVDIGMISIKLINTNGQIVLEQKSEFSSSELTFLVDVLPNGTYFLIVETDKELQVLKVFKSE
jgi:hypothetical protein